MDVIGTSCPGGVAGGDEQTGASQTQTRTLAELGLTTAAELRVVFNTNESGDDSILLENLVLTIYAPDGTPLFDSGVFVPQAFLATDTGVGNSGFVFRLDDIQAAAAEAAFANPSNRIGLSANVEETSAGNEVFFVADFGNLVAPVSVLEIPTLGRWGGLLLALLVASAGFLALRFR